MDVRALLTGVLLLGCSSTVASTDTATLVDSGQADARVPETSAPDTASVDALPDASLPDAPARDARDSGTTDTGVARDGASPDGGVPTTSIAERHCGDNGIEADPDVIFVERFDEGSIANAARNWDNVDSMSAMSISTTVPPGSASTTSSRWSYRSTGAMTVGFVKMFPGEDEVYFRYYIFIESEGDPLWHFFRMGGGSPYGGAGMRPDGTDRFATALEPNYTRWRWDFYTYWPDMHADSAGTTYGNGFLGKAFSGYRDLGPMVARGRWVGVEMMVKLNTPGSYDGEQAFWLDGQPVVSSFARSGTGTEQVISRIAPGTPRGGWVTSNFCPDSAGMPFDSTGGSTSRGLRWRTTPSLRVNYIRPILYNENAQNNASNFVTVSNIVVARRYIGPIVPCP